MPTKSEIQNSQFGASVTGYANRVETPVAIPVKSRTRTWSQTPGFTTKKQFSEELPMLPYTDAMIERKLVSSSLVLYRPDITAYSTDCNYSVLLYEDPPSINFPNTENDILWNKALAKLPARVNGSQFNLPLFFAEYHKTQKMVVDLLQDIRRRFKGASTRRQAWNIWLEYRYGWRLLVMDIYSALEALHSIRTTRSVMQVNATATSAYDTILVNKDRYSSTATRYFTPGMVSDYTLLMDYKFGTTVTVRYRESNATLGTLQQWGITNPLGLGWELIRYSFIIDWIIPVGQYLSTLDTWVGKDFISGTRSDWCDIVYTAIPKNYRDPLNPAWTEKPGARYGASAVHRRSYKRQVLASFPKASLPSVQLNLNASRILDLIALTRQGSHNKLLRV